MAIPINLAKVTVIVPVYNRADSLKGAIGSILGNSESCQLDILIVDDGSTDETPIIISELAAAHPEIRVIRRENGGVTKARNTGLSHIPDDTDIVTFLDSDDLMARGRIAADIRHFAQLDANGREVAMTYGRMIVTNALDTQSCTPTNDAISKNVISIHLTCGLYRRSLIQKVGYFDEDLLQSEDTDYLLRMFEEGTVFVQTETVCHYYLRHAGNMTKRLEEAKKFFALAVFKSIQRRRSNPGRAIHKPAFDLRLPAELR